VDREEEEKNSLSQAFLFSKRLGVFKEKADATCG
jgi:hypothetical protein